MYTMTSTGASVTNVTPASLQSDNVAVTAWSPDGTTLACLASASGAPSSIYLINLDGGTLLDLTPAGFSDTWAAFSPDNQKIAFYRNNLGGANPGIYVSDFAGGNPQLLVPDPTTGATGPVQSFVWSPFLEGEVILLELTGHCLARAFQDS